jgi:hypothetical protein
MVPGKISSTMVKAHMQVPNAKKSASNFIPTGVAAFTVCFCTVSLTNRHNLCEFAWRRSCAMSIVLDDIDSDVLISQLSPINSQPS